MGLACYDDRNDARLSMMAWLRGHSGEAVNTDAVRRIVRQVVTRDGDPVDPIADSWREASYGASLGILEYIAESLPGTMDAQADCLRAALEGLHGAPRVGGGRLAAIRRALASCRECLRDGADRGSPVWRAIELAATMINLDGAAPQPASGEPAVRRTTPLRAPQPSLSA